MCNSNFKLARIIEASKCVWELIDDVYLFGDKKTRTSFVKRAKFNRTVRNISSVEIVASRRGDVPTLKLRVKVGERVNRG